MYLGNDLSKTLPPNAINLFLTSCIGNISLFLYISAKPVWVFFTRFDAIISSLLNPLACNSL